MTNKTPRRARWYDFLNVFLTSMSGTTDMDTHNPEFPKNVNLDRYCALGRIDSIRYKIHGYPPSLHEDFEFLARERGATKRELEIYAELRGYRPCGR